MNSSFYSQYSSLQKYVEDHLEAYLSRRVSLRTEPGIKQLIETMTYALGGRAGRIRPVLACLTAEMLGGKPSDVIDFACSVELIHTYSLIHDDLPCMDDDDFRRGRPSTHKKYGEALAVLTGDALATESFRWIAEKYKSQPQLALTLIEDLSTAVGPQGMVGGQAVDLVLRERETAQEVTQEEIELLHSLKTGAVFKVTVLGAGKICRAGPAQMEALEQYGHRLGLIFQIADDMGDDDETGELSFVKTVGLEKAREICENLVTKAQDALSLFGERATGLKNLARYVCERTKPNELLRMH